MDARIYSLPKAMKIMQWYACLGASEAILNDLD